MHQKRLGTTDVHHETGMITDDSAVHDMYTIPWANLDFFNSKPTYVNFGPI